MARVAKQYRKTSMWLKIMFVKSQFNKGFACGQLDGTKLSVAHRRHLSDIFSLIVYG